MAGNVLQKLDTHEIERYARQLILPAWGIEEQLKLQQSSVAVLTGFVAAPYLAGAGVGTIGLPKEAAAVSDQITALNPSVKIKFIENSANIGSYDGLIAQNLNLPSNKPWATAFITPGNSVLSCCSKTSSKTHEFTLPCSVRLFELAAGIMAAAWIIRELKAAGKM